MISGIRKEMDSLGEVNVPAGKLRGAQTQRSLEHLSIGKDLIPREMVTAYAILKKATANANHAGNRLDHRIYKLIVQACDKILDGQHHDMFPLHVLDNRQRHSVQHECERSDLQQMLPTRGHTARQQEAGSPERPRKHAAIVERQFSFRNVYRCRSKCGGAINSRGEGSA
jgi:hypothetical protein